MFHKSFQVNCLANPKNYENPSTIAARFCLKCPVAIVPDGLAFVYLYYYPVGSKPVQNLSHFLFTSDSLQLSSEKVLLQVPVQRETCCHSAGNVYFGPDGLLYLSTGDNTRLADANNRKGPQWQTVSASLAPSGSTTNLFFVFHNDQVKDKNLMILDWILFGKS